MADILDPNASKHTWKLTNEALGFEIEFTGRVIVEQKPDEEEVFFVGLLSVPIQRPMRPGRVIIRTELEPGREVTVRDKRKKCDPRFAGLIIDPNLSLKPDLGPTPDRRPGPNPPTAL